jgi:hypothetical protein
VILQALHSNAPDGHGAFLSASDVPAMSLADLPLARWHGEVHHKLRAGAPFDLAR